MVIRRIMQQLDSKVDQSTHEAIMESCGQACYEGAHGKRSAEKPTPEQVEKFLAGMRKYVGADNVRQSGDETLIYFRYTANPQGLNTSVGPRLAPAERSKPGIT
jgi:hypothetical protein